jgi:hypothetical protein
MGKEKRFLFVWRKMFMSEYGPESSTTRHVLHALGAHMNLEGGSCFPSVVRLMKETKLSKQTVITHIKKATQEGWIKLSSRRANGKGWRRNSYQAVIPRKVLKVVKQDDHINEGDLNKGEDGLIDGEGGQTDSDKVVKQFDLSTSIITSKKSSCDEPAQNLDGLLDGSSEYYEPTKKEWAELKKKVSLGMYRNKNNV